jgi:hypothetical protein
MTDIRVAIDQRRKIEDAHRAWASELPRGKGQIGGAIVGLVEGGQTTTTISFYGCDPDFVRYLKEEAIQFWEV